MKMYTLSDFTRNVLVLMTGTAFAQAIPIAISPILTRIYSPDDFGVYALYISIVAFVSIISTGRYELAIMLPKKDSEAMNILAFSISIALCVSLVLFLIIYFFDKKIADFLGNKELVNWLYFIPVSVLCTSIYQSLNYWNSRKKLYNKITTASITQSANTAVANLSFGFYGLNNMGLILGGLFGKMLATGWLIHTFYKEKRLYQNNIRKLKSIALIKKYRKMPLISLPNAFIDGLRLTGITLLIAKLFSVSTLGQFSLAWKMLQIPISFMGSSLSQVFFQEISQKDRKELYSLVKAFVLKSIVMAFPIFIGLYMFSEDIFVFVFSDNWLIAGKIASIMAPWMFLNFISAPLSNIFVVINRQEVVLGVSVLYMLVPLSLLYFFQGSEFLDVIRLITLVMSVILIIYIGSVFYLLRKNHEAL